MSNSDKPDDKLDTSEPDKKEKGKFHYNPVNMSGKEAGQHKAHDEERERERESGDDEAERARKRHEERERRRP